MEKKKIVIVIFTLVVVTGFLFFFPKFYSIYREPCSNGDAAYEHVKTIIADYSKAPEGKFPSDGIYNEFDYEHSPEIKRVSECEYSIMFNFMNHRNDYKGIIKGEAQLAYDKNNNEWKFKFLNLLNPSGNKKNIITIGK